MAAGPCESLRNFNPRSPHGERPPEYGILPVSVYISIHAPRTGSDLRAGRAGCDGQEAFQSTLPARGATIAIETLYVRHQNFNPRSPHGERPTLPYSYR